MRRYAGVSSGPHTEECSASMMLSELKYDADRRYSDLFCLQDITYCIRTVVSAGPYQMHVPVSVKYPVITLSFLGSLNHLSKKSEHSGLFSPGADPKDFIGYVS